MVLAQRFIGHKCTHRNTGMHARSGLSHVEMEKPGSSSANRTEAGGAQ